MSDGALLLAAILADPDEDTPRLVYADWLEENGSPERAEFIRVQIDIERLFTDDSEVGFVCVTGDSRGRPGKWFALYKLSAYRKWSRREKKLLNAIHSSGLCYNHTGWFAVAQHRACAFHALSRGFLCELHCQWEYWIAHSTAILAAHPVRKVTLTTYPNHLEYVVSDGKAYRNGLRGTNPSDTWILKWPGIEFDAPRLTQEDLLRDFAAPTPTHEPPLSVE